MAKGEVVIDEDLCLGCGYCAHFCSRGCIVITGDKFNPQGRQLPTLCAPEKCNACGVCVWMCPHFAIEVYEILESPATYIPAHHS